MDLDLLGFSLSIGLCLSMLGLACEARERFCQGRKTRIPKREAFRRLGLSTLSTPLGLLLRVLLSGRAADDASDAFECVCFPPHPPRVSS